MRTNIVIENELMEEALRVSGARTKREVVERGLRTLIRLHSQERLRGLRGRAPWDADLDAMRTDDRPADDPHPGAL